jgi:hypothetical protein
VGFRVLAAIVHDVAAFWDGMSVMLWGIICSAVWMSRSADSVSQHRIPEGSSQGISYCFGWIPYHSESTLFSGL